LNPQHVADVCTAWPSTVVACPNAFAHMPSGTAQPTNKLELIALQSVLRDVCVYLDASMFHKALQRSLKGLGVAVPIDHSLLQLTALHTGRSPA